MSDRMDAGKVMRAAEDEARAMGSSRVEAEHLLLALAASPRLAAGRLLAARGLDHAAVRDALTLEFRLSLEAAGVSLAEFSLPSEALPLTVKPRLAQSAKLAFHRAVRTKAARKDRRFDSLHLLLGILATDAGTVPRALAAADVDRAALSAAARAALEIAA